MAINIIYAQIPHLLKFENDIFTKLGKGMFNRSCTNSIIFFV